MNQYFPDDQNMILKKHTHGVKYPFKLQDGSIDFIVMEYEKFVNVISDSTLQLNLKKLPESNFGIVSNNHNFLKMPLKDSCFFQLRICVRPDFLQLLQPKQHFTTD